MTVQVSIEVPVFKGKWLIPCIDSVLHQTSSDWELSLVWDGGDELSRAILERIEKLSHPRIHVWFRENQGIARARRFLTEHSGGQWILPLDDDDVLAPEAVAAFLGEARAKPWAGIIRAQRSFIDEQGRPVDMPPWFPFEARHYEQGMVTDVFNHCQPYLIRRSAYDRTSGWEGFEDFGQAGEDCDIFTKIEEVATIELLPRILYHYRLNSQRASNGLGAPAAKEMWRRIADRTIARIGLPLRRVSDEQPFRYERLPRRRCTAADVDFVVPYFEADEAEFPYAFSRPRGEMSPSTFVLNGHVSYEQRLDTSGERITRIDVACASMPGVDGDLQLTVSAAAAPALVLARGTTRIDTASPMPVLIRVPLEWREPSGASELMLRFDFLPRRRNRGELRFYVLPSESGAQALMRIFYASAAHSRVNLDRCLASLRRNGIPADAIHVVPKQQSSAANRNEGFSRTSRPLVCYVDDDVEFDAGVVEKLVAELEEHDADLAAPQILDVHGRVYCAEPFFDPKQLVPMPRALGEENRGAFNYTAEVPWLPSTMLLVRREVVRAVGGFDEAFIGSQMEDVDFCLRARQRGFRCIYAGAAAITHHNHQRNDCFNENYALFRARWSQYPALFAAVPRTTGVLAQ